VKLAVCAVTLISIFGCGSALAIDGFPKPKTGFETCLTAALKAKPGTVVKVELKTEKGIPIYEFDIERDGKAWDVECDGHTGKVTEIEEEVAGPDAPAFKAKAKISVDEAKKIATTKYPGEVIEIEYEIQSNGDAAYEFDIVGKDGKEWKVEVDAASGKIIEANQEFAQIGRESGVSRR
jgi:uncharacterized membrane protein YkoI